MIVVCRVTVFVYASHMKQAEQWARDQGIRRRDFVAFGSKSRWGDGIRFNPTDRIVVIGEISRRFESAIERSRSHISQPPQVERISPALADIGANE